MATLAAGKTAHWETIYGDGLDEGIVVQAPNLLDESATNIEMVVLNQSVVLRRRADGSAGVAYRVAILNAGNGIMTYNLDIEDWQ